MAVDEQPDASCRSTATSSGPPDVLVYALILIAIDNWRYSGLARVGRSICLHCRQVVDMAAPVCPNCMFGQGWSPADAEDA